MKRAELVALFDEIITILESENSAVEKISRIEAAMFEPESADADDEGDRDEDDED
jgi:hypothetical protein